MHRKMARAAIPEEQRARLREVDQLRNARGLRAEGSLTQDEEDTRLRNALGLRAKGSLTQDEEDTHDILTNIAIQRARAAA